MGGAARNPLAELMQLVSDLHDARTGRVKVPGFYDEVAPLSARERDEFRRSGFSLATCRRDNRLRRLRTSDPVEVLERIWAQPTFEVHGVAGGYAGPGIKSIVPGHAEVMVSCAMSFAFGRTPAFVRDGGTIGAVVSMGRILGCPIAFLNLSLPEHGYHAPNENFDWGRAAGGMAAFARYLEDVADTRATARPT